MIINNHSSRMKISKDAETQNIQRITKMKKLFRAARTMKEKQELADKLFGKSAAPL